MLNHSLTPHVALGRHETKQEESDIVDNDNSFELRMIRSCNENEEIFSTYDKEGVRTAASWLLNYGFVPLKLTHEISGTNNTEESNASESTSKEGSASEELTSTIGFAVEELRQCGPHTHGAIRLVTHAKS